ncbi:MAG: amidohydrolase [Clostridia bacterium]|nr:amidohydrolase [Clostridia bacterium]
MQDLLIKNGKVLRFKESDVVIEKKDILVKEGKIVQIQENIEEKRDMKVIDATKRIVMPGLINTHAHIPMSIFRETTEGCKLYEWLNEKIWPREDKLTKEDVYWASMLSYYEMISTGTTTINDQYFMSEEIRKAAEDCKVRAVITRPIMDADGSFEQRIKEFREFYESRDRTNDLITYSVAPHSLYTCSDECLQATADLAREYHLPIHVHFLESIDEIQDIQKQHGKKAIEVLKEYFEGIHTILAHGVHLDDEDIKILKTMDCGIAHNPISNLRLGCTIADTTKYLQEGINVAIGTDGQGSGSNLDMFEAMRVACLIQGGIHENEGRITAKDVLRMATINGAKLLGLEDKVGSIEIGKDADLILVNVEENLDNITMLPNLNEIANLVYNTSGRNVQTTIVKGEVLMENRQMKIGNVQEVIEKCKEIAERIAK